MAALLTRMVDLIRRAFGRRRREEPPAGAPVPARLGPKGPKPLAGAVALREPHRQGGESQ